MNPYWIAIEGGGTRSTLSIVSNSLEEFHSRQGPPLHAKRLTLDTLANRVKQLVEKVLSGQKINFKSIRGIGLALAGADRKDDQQNIRNALNAVYPDTSIFITSDVRATHVGAFSGDPGILVIAGTGSIVLAKNGNKWQRAGGYGWRMGDEGSGHQIGVEGLRSVGRDYDGQQSTGLTQKLEHELGISSRDELIEWTYDGEHHPSDLAPIVIQSAKEGDPVCQSIIEKQVEQLADLVRSLSEKLNLPEGPVACHGGLFESQYYYKTLKTQLQKISSDYRFNTPSYNPRIGLCLMMQ